MPAMMSSPNLGVPQAVIEIIKSGYLSNTYFSSEIINHRQEKQRQYPPALSAQDDTVYPKFDPESWMNIKVRKKS